MKALPFGAALSLCLATGALADPDKVLGIPMARADLLVRTAPAGARVRAVYGTAESNRSLECVAPCTLNIPVRRAFALSVVADGYRAVSAPAVTWRRTALGHWVLSPGEVTITMEKVQ